MANKKVVIELDEQVYKALAHMCIDLDVDLKGFIATSISETAKLSKYYNEDQEG